jgi:hypothetical protein
MNATKNTQEFALTRGCKKMIEAAIIETGSTNSYVIMNHICDSLTDRFAGDTLDYQTRRMNLNTTGDILAAIDTYMYRQVKNNKITIKKSKEEE